MAYQAEREGEKGGTSASSPVQDVSTQSNIFWGYADKTTESVVNVMKLRGIIMPEDYIADWKNIQTTQTVKTGVERVAAYRERKKAAK